MSDPVRDIILASVGMLLLILLQGANGGRARVPGAKKVAGEVTKRLAHTKDKAYFMIPTAGTSRYAVEGGPLRDPEGDQMFFDALKSGMPKNIEVIERDLHAEDPAFVKECVDRLVSLIGERVVD